MVKAHSTESFASVLLAVGSCAAGLFYYGIRYQHLQNKQQPNTAKNQSLVLWRQQNAFFRDWLLLVRHQALNFLPVAWFSKAEAQPGMSNFGVEENSKESLSSKQITGAASRSSSTKTILSVSKDDDDDDDNEKSPVQVELRSPPRILKTKSVTVDFTPSHPSLLSSGYRTPDALTVTTTTGTMTDDDATASICSTASRTQRRAIFGPRVTSKYVNSPDICSIVPAS